VTLQNLRMMYRSGGKREEAVEGRGRAEEKVTRKIR
jgi:hypothetical protein